MQHDTYIYIQREREREREIQLRLSEFSGVVLNSFAFSHLTGVFSGCIARETGRIVQPVAQSTALLNIMGQEIVTRLTV